MNKRFYVDNERWLSRIAELCRSGGVVGLDIETYPMQKYRGDKRAGLDPHMSEIRAIQLAVGGHTWLIDLYHVKDVTPILRLLADQEVTFVIHNAVFETKHFLHKYDAYPENVFCTMLASRLLKPVGQDRWGNSLEIVADLELGIKIDKSQQKSDWSVPDLTDEQIEYAYRDAEILVELYPGLRDKLAAIGMTRAAKIEFDCVLAIAELELAGIRYDDQIIAAINNHIVTRTNELKRFLATELPGKRHGIFEPEPVDLNSNTALAAAFMKRTGVKLPLTETKTGKRNYEVNKGVLVRYRSAFPDLVDAILDYSSLIQMKSTFCDALEKHINPATGRLHPEYKQIGQEQHRSAANKPNMNFPRANKFGSGVRNEILAKSFYSEYNFRRAFIPEDGNLFSIVDYANNQLRLIADSPFANIKSLQEEFSLGKSADPFRRIASNGLSKAKTQVTEDERQMYKLLTYALAFIASAKRYQSSLMSESRIETSYEECQRQINLFYRAVPEMAAWHNAYPPMVKAKGYCESIIGRRVYIPQEWMTDNRAVNFPICLSEVDGAKLAFGRLVRKLRRDGYKAKPVIFVYDELVFEGSQAEIPNVLPIQEQIMTESMQEMMRDVAALAEGSIANSWGGKK